MGCFRRAGSAHLDRVNARLRRPHAFPGKRACVVDLRDDHRQVIEALRDLPGRQRDCLVLRYYHELGIEEIASTLGLSANSVKTHLGRGLAALETSLGARR